jgi:hypothetical protein
MVKSHKYISDKGRVGPILMQKSNFNFQHILLILMYDVIVAVACMLLFPSAKRSQILQAKRL